MLTSIIKAIVLFSVTLLMSGSLFGCGLSSMPIVKDPITGSPIISQDGKSHEMLITPNDATKDSDMVKKPDVNGAPGDVKVPDTSIEFR